MALTGNVYTCVLIISCILCVNCRPSIKDSNPNQTEMCKLPAIKGHCRALIPRWTYNPSTKKCHEFNFGGCDGNGNNFDSYKSCMTTCNGIS